MVIIWLPIEPKWNWNIVVNSGTILHWSFQSNQSGIETTHLCLMLNRLILPIEPKWNWNGSGPKKLPYRTTTSNRTKVELKQRNWNIKGWTFRLPIEPKWNWNKFLLLFMPYGGSSNRTKVELKLLFHRRSANVAITSNRTKVELKLGK